MRILANDGIDDAGKKILEQAGHTVDTDKIPQEELPVRLPSYDGLVVRSATKVRKDLLDACPQLRFVARAGVGMDNIDVDYARSRGVLILNTPSASSIAVAELVFAHLLSLCRFLHRAHREMPLRGASDFNQLKSSYAAGTELFGKTLGLVGFGRIGQEVARIAHGFRMKILVHDVLFQKEPSLALKAEEQHQVHTVGMEELLQHSHYLSLHVPGLAQALIGERELNLLPPGACIINASRGGLIDEEALIQAIHRGHIRYAGLDVFENEPQVRADLLTHPQISTTPHTGASTLEAQERIGLEMAQRILEHFPMG
ncbi:MAG: D-2-hydroxyacid dehydrogenase [Bacteroidota bacterium]